MELDKIEQAVACGWCTPENETKVVDPKLVKAISLQVSAAICAEEEPYLGCATTRQLFEEIIARMDETELSYRSIDD